MVCSVCGVLFCSKHTVVKDSLLPLFAFGLGTACCLLLLTFEAPCTMYVQRFQWVCFCSDIEHVACKNGASKCHRLHIALRRPYTRAELGAACLTRLASANVDAEAARAAC